MPGGGPDSPKVQNLVNGSQHSFYLTHAVMAEQIRPGVITRMYPTPRSCNGLRSSGSNRTELLEAAGMKSVGSLNPAWVEFLMGYETGWTALDASAMPSSRKSPKSSGGQS
jgi:hypothetical protein